MNDTTLPIPKQTTKNPRRNVRRPPPNNKGVRKGFGLHDWMTLLRHAKDLAQRKGAPLRRDIELSEVRLHDKPYDGWMVLRGKVYNIGPYLAYHPGGSDILEKCLGRDGTILFDKYHSWVNIENLIGPLLLGYVKVEKKRRDEEEDGMRANYLRGIDENSAIVVPNNNNATSGHSATTATTAKSEDLGFAMPKPRPPKGVPVASLLSNNNADDKEDEKEEDVAMLF
eukprot:CAMPEP_0183720924 /NCGR_PEP_ID=MMETSP0737-20130205/13408_1 /TAXON_ID=385413 /ORGANISM="Thalassiosira miniscula, Strain CCMP1093" /LENGTH=225 /DNA_ID=CAMNT_0025950875 /DNA_START=45 /DNA_END=722 /DNA_ORIENTATION=+